MIQSTLDFDAKDTRNQSYRDIQDSLPARRRAVLNALKAEGPMCNREIAAYLRLPVNQVTPRVFELRAQRLVSRVPGRYVDPVTGKTVAQWRAES